MSPFEYISEFPSGQKRKEEIAESANKIGEFKQQGVRAVEKYNWIDSSLDKDPTDNYKSSFFESFQNVLPEDQNHSLKYCIEKQLAGKGGRALAIEFGGTGSRMFSEFTPRFFKQSVGVSLVDHRTSSQKVALASINPRHSVLEGNIIEPEMYTKLTEILGNQKVDFIIERMQLGLDLLPRDPYSLSKILGLWYHMLNEGGIMLIQAPGFYRAIIERWRDELEKHKDHIEFRMDVGDIASQRSPAFWLKKLPGAPKELPLLAPRQLLVDTSDRSRQEKYYESVDRLFLFMNQIVNKTQGTP